MQSLLSIVLKAGSVYIFIIRYRFLRTYRGKNSVENRDNHFIFSSVQSKSRFFKRVVVSCEWYCSGQNISIGSSSSYRISKKSNSVRGFPLYFSIFKIVLRRRHYGWQFLFEYNQDVTERISRHRLKLFRINHGNSPQRYFTVQKSLINFVIFSINMELFAVYLFWWVYFIGVQESTLVGQHICIANWQLVSKRI